MGSFGIGERWTRLLALAALALVCGAAAAANVVLIDGTVIHGEVVSLEDGVYTVRSDSLGMLRVPKAKVRTIEEGQAAGRPAASGASSNASVPPAAAIQGIETNVLQNPDLLKMLLALQNDPDVLAVLSDPKVMSEIAAGDYSALMNDPKIVALMNNAKVRAFVEEVK